MRLFTARAALLGVAAMAAVAAAGCVPVYSGPVSVARVDPEDVAERTMVGAVLGGALGTGIGATVAINPAVGAVIGVEVGAGLGAAIGGLTAQPLPAYEPVSVPTSAVIPGFYDTWPPGTHAPPVAAGTPPPPG